MDQSSENDVFETDDIDMEDPNKVNAWDAIVNTLTQWIGGDDIIFQEVKRLSRSRIGGHNFGAIQTITDYFECLENNMEQSDMLEFLIHLFNCMSFHIHCGTTHVGDRLREYRRRLEECHKNQQRQGIYNDINFVGRQKDIDDIVKMISKPRPDFKGVSICGLGGMGKTSLAREVCFKMRNMKAHWRPKKIELREKSSLLDLLRDTLVKLGEMCINDSVENLKQQVFDLVKEKLYRKRLILLFDNVDDVMKQDRRGILMFFIQLLDILDELGDTCMIRVMVTTRVKLMPEEDMKMLSRLSRKDKRLEGMVQELELKPLQEKDAVTLLQRCTKNLSFPIDEKKCTEIVKLCGYCPLAIRSVSGTLKCGLVSPETMAYNLKGGSRTTSMTEILNVCHCLRQTFDTLDKNFQTKLMQLSVFHTASFKIAAAASVLGEPSLHRSQPIGMETKLDMVYLKSRHLVEIEDLSLDNEDDVVTPIRGGEHIEYSIHPLVYMFLKETEKERQNEFQDHIRKAKLNFLTHFQMVINDIGKMQEKNCLKAQNFLADSRTHVIHFYEMILEFSRHAFKSVAEDTKLDIMLCNKHVVELADLILTSSKKWKCLEKWISEAERDGDITESLFWKVMAALKLLEMDRNEEVHKYIEEIKAILQRMQITDPLKPVLGLFFLLQGQYFVRSTLLDEALEALNNAKLLFKEKSIKKTYRTSLANVLNCMGCVYYKKTPPDIKQAKICHHEALDIVSSKAEDFMNLKIPVYLTNIGTCFYKDGQMLYERDQKKEAKKNFEEALDYYTRALRLDLQMNAHKFDGYAEKLKKRADVYFMLGDFDLAVKDIKESLQIRQRTLHPPHVQLTITTFKVADILRRQAWDKYSAGRKEEGLDILFDSVMHYDMTADLIKFGGISSDHEDYKNIKTSHMRCLKHAQDQRKIKHFEKFYRDFENGKFEKIRQRKRNLQETVKEYLSRDEIIALSGDPNTRQIIPSSSSSSDSDSESDSSSSDNGSERRLDPENFFKDSDDESKDEEMVTPSIESMEQDQELSNDDSDKLRSESSGSSTGSQGISVSEYLARLSSEEGRMSRPSLLSSQSSSTDDDVFGRKIRKGSMDKQGSRESSMRLFLNQVITTGRDERKSRLQSMESSSLEDNSESGTPLTTFDYLEQRKLQHNERKEKKKKLMEMHKAMSFDEMHEDSGMADVPGENEPMSETENGKTNQSTEITVPSMDSTSSNNENDIPFKIRKQ